MATATMPRTGGETKLEYGVPQIVAFKFTSGKNVTSIYPGGRVMFSLVDRPSLFLNDEDAGDLEIRLRELGTKPGEEISLTKVKMAHGGGHALRVEPVTTARQRGNPQPERISSTEALLEKSLEMVRNGQRDFRGAGAFVENAPASTSTTDNSNGNAPHVVLTPASVEICAASMFR